MANRIIDSVNLTNIANAIRNKKGTTNQMLPSQMANEIASIKTATSSGGTDTSDATVNASDVLENKIAYGASGRIVGSMKNNGSQTINVSSANTSYTISKGYHNGSGSVQISSAEVSKLVSSNIKKGITILGVTGSYQGSASSSGIQVKTGTTASTSIHTGLSSIDKFIMYSDSISSEGLINVVYDSSKSAVTLTVCGEYNFYLKNCNVMTQTTGYSVSGGTFQWTDNSSLGSFMHDATYNWIAVGN
jgi:hypothetical protein